MNLQSILDEVSAFAKYHGDRVYERWEEHDIAKMDSDNVDVTTNFDIEIERAFAKFVIANYPDHGFRGEELTELNREGEYIWHIDPLDGTKYFAKGVPLWGTTLALVKGETPVLGIVYNPTTKQMYRAAEEIGSFLNDSLMRIEEPAETNRLQIAMDLTTHKYDWDNLQDKLCDIQSKLMQHFYRVRMLGNGAFALAWLAQGMFGAYVDPYRHRKKFVDVAAGYIIAAEAGAVHKRIALQDEMEQLIVAHPKLINTIEELIRLS